MLVSKIIFSSHTLHFALLSVMDMDIDVDLDMDMDMDMDMDIVLNIGATGCDVESSVPVPLIIKCVRIFGHFFTPGADRKLAGQEIIFN